MFARIRAGVGGRPRVASRRELKKLATFESIVAGAKSLLEENGYESVTIESIAARADVSVGTVYNYFGTKRAILAVVVMHSFDDLLSATINPISGGSVEPVAALSALVDPYVNRMVAFGPEVLMDTFRAGFDPAESDLLAQLPKMDEKIIERTGHQIAQLQEAGCLNRSHDPMEVSLLIYSVVSIGILMYASMPSLSASDVMASIHRQLMIACEGIAST